MKLPVGGRWQYSETILLHGNISSLKLNINLIFKAIYVKIKASFIPWHWTADNYQYQCTFSSVTVVVDYSEEWDWRTPIDDSVRSNVS